MLLFGHTYPGHPHKLDYQPTVSDKASSKLHLVRQPNRRPASEESNLRYCASCGPSTEVAMSNSPPGHRRCKPRASSNTVHASESAGPMFHAVVNSCPSTARSCPSNRQPRTGSRTCCHGRTASGRRIFAGTPDAKAQMMSGTSLSSAQSPPPMTLPARTVATATLGCSESPAEKKACRNALVTNSAQALLLL